MSAAATGRTFHDTLAPRQRHLVARLENFGDIVFGFAISQLVVQLPELHHGPDLLTTPYRWIGYFGTFALLAYLWLQYHRSMTLGFAPRPVDLIFAFVFLAFVGLVPYAMQAYFRFNDAAVDARWGLGAYLVCSIGTTASSLVLNVRGFRRAWYLLDGAERQRAWTALLRVAGVAAGFAIALTVDVVAGFVPASVSFACIVVIVRVLRSIAGVPAPALLRVPRDP